MVTIIASAHAEGGSFTRMLTGRDERSFALDYDPGWKRGDWLIEGERLFGRVVRVSDNGNADDWITGEPTKWWITFERPWNQTDMKTTIGNAKIEWMEDTLFPRVGRVIEVDDYSHFMLGDIVRLG